MVEAEGFLYAIGGNDGSSSLNTVERFDPLNNKWMLITSMMLRRSSVGAAVLECPNLENLLSAKIDMPVTPSTSVNVIANSSD